MWFEDSNQRALGRTIQVWHFQVPAECPVMKLCSWNTNFCGYQCSIEARICSRKLHELPCHPLNTNLILQTPLLKTRSPSVAKLKFKRTEQHQKSGQKPRSLLCRSLGSWPASGRVQVTEQCNSHPPVSIDLSTWPLCSWPGCLTSASVLMNREMYVHTCVWLLCM